jgi:hypothetical protein
VESAQNNEQEDERNANTNGNIDLDEVSRNEQQQELTEMVESISMDNNGAKPGEVVPNESLEIPTPFAELQENQYAPESDSTTGSSSATPFLSPVGELADDSPSDEMSAYFTPPDEGLPITAETASEGQTVLSSPESDRGDSHRRYAYPEIELGDIHKVDPVVFLTRVRNTYTFIKSYY